MDEYGLFNVFENWFDRKVYQNDVFFWSLVMLHTVVMLAGVWGWIDIGTSGWIYTVLAVGALSWVYTNARRRACGRIKAVFFGLLTFFQPIVGGILYFIFRPKELVFLFLPPSHPAVLPVFEGPVWIFAKAPVRFLVKLALWSMGLVFLLIGFLDIFGWL